MRREGKGGPTGIHSKENAVSLLLSLGILTLLLQSGLVGGAPPPFKSVMWLDAGIIRPTDPTAVQGIKYAGRGEREMLDRRLEERTVLEVYLSTLTFDDGVVMEAVQVNPEVGDIQSATSLSLHTSMLDPWRPTL